MLKWTKMSAAFVSLQTDVAIQILQFVGNPHNDRVLLNGLV